MRSRVYAFLDVEHPPVAWAVMRGVLTTAGFADAEPQKGWISFMHAGMIYSGNNTRLFNETIIDVVRRSLGSPAISRLRGMYFFQTRSDAEARIGDKNWPPYFIKRNLVKLELRTPRLPTIVDANWITYAPLSASGRMDMDQISWISRYWRGEPYNSAPVWEVIAEGVAVVRDEQLRRECFARLREMFPNAHIPILMARLAGEAGSRGGQILPFVLEKQNGIYQLGYLGNDADFHDADVIASIARHPDSGALARMMASNETWHRPDFTPWFKEFRLSETSASHIEAFRSLHRVESAYSSF